MSGTTPESPAGPVAGARLGRRALLGGAAASPLLLVRPGAAEGASAPASGVHLTYAGDAQRGMAVSWSTPSSVARPVVQIGRDRTYGITLTADSRASKDVASVYHHAAVEGLQPDTRYYYRISHRGGTARTGSFKTAPAKARPFRFTAFGDMGVNEAAAAHVALIRRMKPELAFVVGDLCYADSSGGTQLSVLGDTQDLTTWDRWLAQIQPSASAVPWMTTVGNHEMENLNGDLGYDGYLDRFELPRNGPAGAPVTYAFRFANVAFIALDGNDVSYEIDRNAGYLGTRQDAWLAKRLADFRARDDIDFIVVGFHNCVYCTNLVHGSDGGMRARWEPLFDRFGVDLVVNGHNHCYERTHPVRAGLAVTEAPSGSAFDSRQGTTYWTVGGAGQAAYPTGGLPASYVVEEGGVKVPEATTWSAVTDEQHSLGFVDVTPRNRDGVATMRLTALATDGTRLDQVTLRRRRG